ncbi:MAG: cobyric acid synthase [Candidatus Scalinduaceae bacterium]
MVQGTGSDVGKSILVCALCRIFHQEGLKVAPFKAQNMSNNSYITVDGREMGRAQVAQAEAAGLQPAVEMNPILLKPTGNNGSQVITMGKPLGHMKANEYYHNKNMMLDIAKKAYSTLSEQYDIIVIEGAGSPSEINLKDNDIVNMKIAEIADASVLLMVDIDRGGAFAWVVGTLELLNKDERERICGVIINKFRGDMTILQSGIDMLEKKIDKPVLGVIPYFDDIKIDDEDSVCLERGDYKLQSVNDKSTEACHVNTISGTCIDIVVIRLPRISNFTDFELLKREKDVNVRFVDKADSLGRPDLVILPGTKNTIGDLKVIKENGIADTVINFAKNGTMVIGICGGYQMLGKEINDPENAESNISQINGLGLLNAITFFKPEKNTCQIKARIYNNNNIFNNIKCDLTGYEIHMGETKLLNGVSPFLKIIERSGKEVGLDDGAISSDGNVIGTYIHGIFDNDEFRFGLINYLRRIKGLSPLIRDELINARCAKDKQYDKLADLIRKHVRMDMIYDLIGELKN